VTGTVEGPDINQIVDSARRLGVEIDRDEAIQWLAAVESARIEADISLDARAGVYGHRVTMLDFSDEDLTYFRRIGAIVGFDDGPDIETALALSGSAAQSKIQTYPGDCDYFERINIRAPTRQAASIRFSRLLRDKAMATMGDTGYRLVEVKYGTYPFDCRRGGLLHAAASTIAWQPGDIRRGAFDVERGDGETVAISWDECAMDAGWCKLDWIVADPVRGQVANASNMLDVTWEAADGSITALDGFIDHYFQEVYLEPESVPLFSKLVQQLSPDALDDNVEALEGEVRKYITAEPKNYGKAAKRMYNVFRYNGSYVEAAYIRELFDEPTAALYQIHAVVRALDEASEQGSAISSETVIGSLDEAVVVAVELLDGEEETEIVRSLIDLRQSITSGAIAERSDSVAAARQRLLNVVNSFFYEKLTAVPSIRAYMEHLG
jgi:hypothetical protein